MGIRGVRLDRLNADLCFQIDHHRRHEIGRRTLLAIAAVDDGGAQDVFSDARLAARGKMKRRQILGID